MKEKPDWKRFEELAADIQRELAPNAKVVVGEFLVGIRSKAKRQIDILIEQEVGQYHIRIVIDCKDYKHPVDIKDLETVMGLVEDVGANKGAIISANGFTAAAKVRAKEAGIDLFRLVDTANNKWKTYVTIPALVRDFKIASFNIKISGVGSLKVANQDFTFMPLFRSDGQFIDYVGNLILDRWEDDTIPRTKGSHFEIQLVPEETFLKTDGILYRADIRANVTVDEVLHFGQLPLTDIRGLSDEISGGLSTTGFTTENIDFVWVEKEWQKVAAVETLAVHPVISLTVSSTYPRYNPSGETKMVGADA